MPPRGRNMVAGVLRLACFRRDGIEQFPGTTQAFLNSLAPWLAFPLVGAGLLLLGGGDLRDAAGDLLATWVALLAPPVVSHLFARAWHREAAWLRYAVAFNWCQWAMPPVGMMIVTLAAVLATLGLPRDLAEGLMVAGLLAYAFGLHWFITRHGLGLSRLRALVVVLAMNVAVGVLVFGPLLLVNRSPGSA